MIIDSDKISRKLTEKGSPYLKILKATFGEDFFSYDGELDRKKLGRYIFAQPGEKAKLEKIVTSAVIKITLDRVKELKEDNFKGIVILDAPLLFECDMQKYTDESWLVAAEPEAVMERVKARDGLKEADIKSRIANQMPIGEKKALADRIIDNSADLAHLYRQLDEELKRLKSEEVRNVENN